MVITLYSYWRSSCSWRVRIVLALKSINYKIISKNLHPSHRDEFLKDIVKINPAAKLPILIVEEDGKKEILIESLPIIEYLDEKYCKNSILPNNIILKQKARAIASLISSGIQPLQNLGLLLELKSVNFNELDFAKKNIERGFEALETILKETSGIYCVGNEITIADVCLIPQVYNAIRFNVDLNKYSLINTINERLMKIEAFYSTKPELNNSVKLS